jgi:gliding motility-associated-like protein
MPTVFTPNGDGANDLYVPVSEHGIQLKSFVILNRWGNVMHETSSSISWDGKQGNQEATPGVYFYTVRYKTIFEDDQIIHGFFHLVR